jgi:guanylate cyclase, other
LKLLWIKRFSTPGTTEGAIEKRNVDLTELPPPLFCRPRKNAKYMSDSKQPSISCITNFGASDNRSMLCESRRQSNAAQRFDLDGTHSLHGSLTGNFRESSPFIPRHRRLDPSPLYINNNESEMYDGLKDVMNGNPEDQEQSKRQVAMVGPMIRSRNLLNSIHSSSEETGECLKSNF